MTDNQTKWEDQALNKDDELLLESFFADMKEDIPDDGFTDRVMHEIPDASHQRLVRWWQVACIVVGIVFLCSVPVVECLQDLLFASKIDMMLQLSHLACLLGEAVGQSRNLLMMLAGAFVMACVWGYNELQEI